MNEYENEARKKQEFFFRNRSFCVRLRVASPLKSQAE